MPEILKLITEQYEDEQFLIIDGFNDCIIGVDEDTMKVIYLESLILKKLMSEYYMKEEVATKHFECCIQGGKFEGKPIICRDFKHFQ